MRFSTDAVLDKPDTFLTTLPTPEPSLGLAVYQAERERCLEADPRRRANYQAFLAAGRCSSFVTHLPIKLDIENVSRCNFRCQICPVSGFERGKRAEDLSLDDLKTLIDEQYGLVEVKLQGLGEPTMQGDPYFEMISYIRAKHIWVRTASNASLLHLKNNYKKLIDSGVNEIQISIDGATADVFEKIRPGSTFEQVVENCSLLNAYANVRRRRVTKAWCVVQRSNFHQLEDIAVLVSEMGFKDLVFAFDIVNWGQDMRGSVSEQQGVTHLMTQELCQTLLTVGKDLGLKVTFWMNLSKYDLASRDSLCPWPFERAVVTSDKRIVPCCKIAVPEHYELGREPGEPLQDVWQSEEYTNFRQMHLDGNLPEVCKECYSCK
jgi:radical SAM protein with 4Fe4S-binding SPASM domain